MNVEFAGTTTNRTTEANLTQALNCAYVVVPALVSLEPTLEEMLVFTRFYTSLELVFEKA